MRALLIPALCLPLMASQCVSPDPIFDAGVEVTRTIRCGDYQRREAELRALADAGKLTAGEFEMLAATRQLILAACDPARPGTSADVLTIERSLLWARTLIDAANKRSAA